MKKSNLKTSLRNFIINFDPQHPSAHIFLSWFEINKSKVYTFFIGLIEKSNLASKIYNYIVSFTPHHPGAHWVYHLIFSLLLASMYTLNHITTDSAFAVLGVVLMSFLIFLGAMLSQKFFILSIPRKYQKIEISDYIQPFLVMFQVYIKLCVFAILLYIWFLLGVELTVHLFKYTSHEPQLFYAVLACVLIAFTIPLLWGANYWLKLLFSDLLSKLYAYITRKKLTKYGFGISKLILFYRSKGREAYGNPLVLFLPFLSIVRFVPFLHIMMAGVCVRYGITDLINMFIMICVFTTYFVGIPYVNKRFCLAFGPNSLRLLGWNVWRFLCQKCAPGFGATAITMFTIAKAYEVGSHGVNSVADLAKANIDTVSKTKIAQAEADFEVKNAAIQADKHERLAKINAKVKGPLGPKKSGWFK